MTAVERLRTTLAETLGGPVALERPGNAEHGDFATNVALRQAAAVKRPPRELAEEYARAAEGLDAVERAEVAGPGFVNLWLSPSWYGEALAEILERGNDYGSGSATAPERIQVEMVSANPTGPITVASARNGAYGDAVARLLEFAGHDVEREYYYNDEGAQMDRFRASVDAAGRGEDPPEDGYHGAYVADLARLPGDPVEHMRAQIEASLERFRIHFDSWALQSEMARHVPDVLERIETYEAEGTLWAPTSKHGDDKDRPLVRSSDGSFLYYAADVAYLLDKLDRGFDRAIYVLGADHHGYVARLKAAASLLGKDPERVEVLLYQLVHLTSGGTQAKMSKRRGDVVFLDEFVDEVGIDAARWFLVNRGPDRTIEIDVDLAKEKTQKNPVYYVQYAHARIAGILRNAGDAAVSAEAPAALAPEERALVKRLTDFPELVREAAERRGPHAVPEYAIGLADDFHRFYHEHRVLESDEQAFRLALVQATRNVLARSLALVGVEAPERM